MNVGADDAVRPQVADLLAPDVPALPNGVDGRQLRRPHGPPIRLRTTDAMVSDQPVSLVQQLLHALIDPSVAYPLMPVAVYGLVTEVSSPGAILPGTVGGISAILALGALSGLPLDLAGTLLVLLSFLLFVADIKAPTHGILTVGGMVSLVVGSAFLVDTGAVGAGVSPRLIVLAAVSRGAVFGFAVRKAPGTRSAVTMEGEGALQGALGEARQRMEPAGSTVPVTGRDGDRPRVAPVSRPSPS